MLRYYFSQGYEYDVIIVFLSKFHGERYKSLGVQRRGADFYETEVRTRIQLELDGPGCLSSYIGVSPFHLY